MTYAETCFLLAEAKVRWNIAAIAETPEDLYNTGVNEAIRFLKIYDEKALAIPQSEIDSYLAANPLTAGTEVEQINMQLWILHLTNRSKLSPTGDVRIPQTHPAVQRLHPRREGREDAAPAELSDLRKPLQCGQLSGSHRTARRQGRLDQAGMVGQKQYLLK